MTDDIVKEFLAESWENLGQLDSEIVQLEKRPTDTDLIASIFRTIHTIKGTCGFLGLPKLESVAHSAENVLGQMRSRALPVTPDAISLVLEAVDRTKELLDSIEMTGAEDDGDDKRLIHKLDLLASVPQSFSKPETPEPATADTPEAPELATPEPDEPENSVDTEPAPIDAPIPTPDPEPVNAAAAVPSANPEPTPGPSAPPKPSEPANKPAPSKEQQSKGWDETARTSELSIRIDVQVLDHLMNLVGELVLTRNQLLQLTRGDEESRYATPVAQLNRVTTHLQEGVMKTRMQPIGNAWNKLPRLVRDLANVTEKQIDLELYGAETELDRTVLDAIKDPLTHMVRNSADHGIESPQEREQLGKPETGRIHLKAYHEGGHVIIRIDDDGRGIAVDKVREKAIRQGLISEADAELRSEADLMQFIFHPGFSTAEKISSVSGRGVGMDVVKTQIEKIGGTIELTSQAGRGTTIKIKIPLTLAIISALIVEAGGESFAIPQLGVVELVRLSSSDLRKIERIRNHEFYRLRDRLLPLIPLHEIVGLEDGHRSTEEANIAVVQVGEDQFGILVSQVFDTEEIVVKPVGSLLKHIDIYQGTTILGDGRVIMILDIAGIANQNGGLPSNDNLNHELSDSHGPEPTNVLLFNAGDNRTMGVPLSLVARLEEIPKEQIETAGRRKVVQYRDQLLPLLTIDGTSSVESSTNIQPVIVFSEGNNSMGLMVQGIRDIIEERLTMHMNANQPGVLGTAILGGQAVDVIDTHYYINQANPEWYADVKRKSLPRVLVVDDSIFFRQLITTTLESQGYEVVACGAGDDAIGRIDRGERFQIIVSDLEMPSMDGFQFANACRVRPELKSTKLIAMTALQETDLENRAKDAGYDATLRKFDPTALVSTIRRLCETQGSQERISA
ncbi:hybrid sensor histidine kinase/response regulator [Thalassoroseus pseudoceratinae]|uniref:hybrid sensor histidine kinase/response regulator n=1 Tax=Thalassoroseus pseudoceratinae TaxID=2713176 RepID=UPI00141F7771|nr:chemotaxis protein CheW [Thalassoroseus pseudoceratinae]